MGSSPTVQLEPVRLSSQDAGEAMDQGFRHVRTATVVLVVVALSAAAGVWARSTAAAPRPASLQDPVRPPQEVRITARKYAFSPSRIEVQENDLVKVTMDAVDIPHSFTIDDHSYRIAKRATPGHPAVFEFRADKAGTFTFYCNLTTDPNCRNMRGELVVKPRK
jgi:cytochrome c oxidase subunit II